MKKCKQTIPLEISSEKRKREKEEQVLDPRFFAQPKNSLRYFENYKFLYDKEKEAVQKRKERGENVKSSLSRMEARERYLKLKEKEQERRDAEIERVREGKAPFYLSRKRKRIEEAIDTAKNKGVEYVVNKIKKKIKEKENRSRKDIELPNRR
ncbi:hypothetical protein NECID01_0408 [Nematocida sp. AWRm77]|nr:hypothetical protein NECID01_0408 [Nematocida sp. AWRm77]